MHPLPQTPDPSPEIQQRGRVLPAILMESAFRTLLGQHLGVDNSLARISDSALAS
jgi:hypothetical protein